MVLEKSIAREKFRRLRSEHSVEEKREADQALARRVSQFLSETQPQNVLAYRPLKTEANPFLDGIPHPEFSYPEVAGDIFHAMKDGEVVNPEDLDMVLIPGIAFDRHGNRLGFGKGYYDRYLKTTPPQRVGIAYSFQVSSEELAVEEWDESVDWIVTERFVLHVERKDQRQWKS